MFDLVVGNVNRPFRERAMVPTLISIAGHGVVVLVLVVLPLMFAANHLPVVPTMMAFVVAAPPAAPPPPPPPPPASATTRTPPRPEAVSTAGGPSFPVDAPSEIRPEPAGEGSEGFEGGVEGGIVGGTIGGIVGGLTAAPPPPPPPPPPAAPAAPVRIGGAIQAPALVHRVEPVYPPLATMAQIGGMVILEAVVDVEGRVESVRVLRSVKFLDGAAIDAVKQWRYSPLVLNRIPTPFVLTVTVSFAMARR